MPLEIVVVDDGSTDNSVEVIREIVGDDPRVTLLLNKENMGSAHAMTRGRRHVAGQYVYNCAADDCVLPGFFKKAMRLASDRPDAGIVFGVMVEVDPQWREVSVGRVDAWPTSRHVTPEQYLSEFLEQQLGHSMCAATIYRKAALEETGGLRPELGSWRDTFLARALALKYGACYVAEPCVKWARMPGSISQSLGTKVLSMLDIIARAAWLMRSDEFSDRFPPDYVDRWEKWSRDLCVGRYLGRFQDSLGSAKALYAEGHPHQSMMSRLVGWAFLAWLGGGRRLWGRCLRYALNRYAGDVSCYQDARQQRSGRREWVARPENPDNE